MKSIIALFVAMTFVGLSFLQIAKSEDTPKTGKTIFEESKCTNCHGIASQSIEAKKKSDKIPDLSKLTEGHNAAFWTNYLKKEETLNSKKHAVPFKGTDEDLKIMVDWLISLNAK